jgi:hypothetical protein
MQQIERSVNARDPNSLPALSDPVRDLLRRETAVLCGQKLDNRAAGAAGAMTGSLERLAGALGPGVGGMS